MGTFVVTGSCGFIGWHLVHYLLSWNHNVIGIDDLRSSVVTRGGAIALMNATPNFHFVETQDFHIETVCAHTKVDVIFHLASPVGPVGVLDDAGSIANQIIRGAMEVAKTAVGHNARLVFVSTSEVYGGGYNGLCREDMACTFQTEASARQEYALGKLAAECALRNWGDALDLVIIRPFNVAGPRQNAKKGFVIPRFVQQALDGKPLTVFNEGDDLRAMTHVQDIVEGLWAAYVRGKGGEVYNLGNPDNIIAMKKLAHMVATHPLSQNGGAIEHVDPALLFPGYAGAPNKFPDSAKAADELMWYPHRSIADIIEDAFQWEVTRRGMDQ